MAQTQRKRRLMGDINVVPYIDVMLVLLVIFMVTAPLLTQGIKVDLPRAAAQPIAPSSARNQQPLVLSIDREGRWYLNVGREQSQPLERKQAAARATAVLRRTPEVTVLVKADRRVDYGQVVDGMVMLSQAGAHKLGFLTDPPPRAGATP
jgi:biopolymer transport protein TolR